MPAFHGTATSWWRGLDPLERLGHRDDVGVPLGLHWTGDEDGISSASSGVNSQGLCEPTEPTEKVGAGRRQQVTATQRRGLDRIERGEPGRGAVRQSISTARFSSTTGEGAISASAS